MPEKTARCTTMSDGVPNEDSGGTDYPDQSGAHPTSSITHGVSTAARRIDTGRSTRLHHLGESLL
jgi:hypothetical protein